MLFFDEVGNSEITCSCKVLKCFVTIVTDVYLFVDSTETQAISNNKRINEIILRQVIVSLFEFTDLLRIEDMNL